MTVTRGAGRRRDPDPSARKGRSSRLLSADGLVVAAAGVVVSAVARGAGEMRLGLAAVLAATALLIAVLRRRWVQLLSLVAAALPLLIREAGRRSGMGWPGMVLLGAAFGVVQVGLVDQTSSPVSPCPRAVSNSADLGLIGCRTCHRRGLGCESVRDRSIAPFFR